MRRVYVDVDTQYDFCDPAGALFVTGAPAAAVAAVQLVHAAVEAGDLVVGSVDSHAHDAWEFATNTNRGPAGEKPDFPPHCVKGTAGWLKLPATLPPRFAFVPVVEDPKAAVRVPRDTQAVYFEKEVYSLFANPNAGPVLDALSPRGAAVEFVVFGVATDYCVKAAALGLLDWLSARPERAGSRVVLATDAVAAVTPDGGRAALDAMARAGVTFMATRDLLSRLATAG